MSEPSFKWSVGMSWGEKPTESCRLDDISGWFKSNNGGPYVRAFEKAFAEFLDVKYAYAVSSGSAALYIALMACEVKDLNVAVPTYTHIGSVAPIVLARGYPMFVDADEFGNLDPQDLEETAWGMPKAIIPVHQLGMPCDMDEIKDIVERRRWGSLIIEDASHALGSSYKGRNCGLLGDIGCFSVGGGRTKTIGTGEGGMIVTNNEELAERIKNIRNHGDRNFDVNYFCFNFRMSDLNAAVGLIQMDKLQFLIDWQVSNAQYIIERLPSYLEVPKVPSYKETCRYLIGCHFNEEKAGITRQEFLDKMKPFQIGPREFVGGGYSKLISDVKFYMGFADQKFPMSEKLLEESVWIDWHRHPRTKEEIDLLLKALNEITVKEN